MAEWAQSPIGSPAPLPSTPAEQKAFIPQLGSSMPFRGPGIFAQGLSGVQNLIAAGTGIESLRTTPQEVYRRTTPALQGIVGTLASIIPSPVGGFLGRMATQGAISGSEGILAGESTEDAMARGILGGLLQGGMEGATSFMASIFVNPVFARLARKGANLQQMAENAWAKATNIAAMKGYGQQVKELKSGYDAAMREFREASKAARSGTAEDLITARATARETNMANQASVRQQVAEREQSILAGKQAFGESRAAAIADEMKARTPALSEFPSTTAGLKSMISGAGPQKVAQAYESAMNAAKDQAAGRAVSISENAAKELGVTPIVPREPTLPGGKGPVVVETGDGMVRVDAADLIEAMTGKSAKRKAYREAVTVLDTNGIGTAEARQQYKDFMGAYGWIMANKPFVKSRWGSELSIPTRWLLVSLPPRSISFASVGSETWIPESLLRPRIPLPLLLPRFLPQRKSTRSVPLPAHFQRNPLNQPCQRNRQWLSPSKSRNPIFILLILDPRGDGCTSRGESEAGWARCLVCLGGTGGLLGSSQVGWQQRFPRNSSPRLRFHPIS